MKNLYDIAKTFKITEFIDYGYHVHRSHMSDIEVHCESFPEHVKIKCKISSFDT
jgi:hypothetical protein